MDEAKEALRALVDKIVLSPKPDGEGLTVDLHGALAGLLRLATGQPALAVAKGRHANAASGGSHEAVDNFEELVLVAGARFQKYSPLHKDRWPAYVFDPTV